FTGQVPHGAEYKTVASVAPEYAWIDEIVPRMIQQDPQRRPESVDAVKREFMARQHDYVTRQRLSEIRNTVIPVGEEDDPLAFDPPKVTAIDWKDGELTLFLDRRVNGGWAQALPKIRTYNSIGRVTPHMIRVAGDRIVAQAQEHEVQTAVNNIK